MNQKITFTAFLQDEYSKKFDKLANTTDSDIKKIEKDLSKFSKTGTLAARSINDLNKRIEVLTRVKKLTIDTKAIKFATAEIKALEKERDKLEGKKSGGGMLGGLGKGFAIAGIAAAGGMAVKSFVQGAVEANMEREQQRISMGVLLGGQGKGDKMLGDVTKMAAATPFETKDLLQASQTMLGFGVNAEKVLPIMSQLGDISGGNKERFQSLSLAFSQMHSTGHLMGQDLLQMVNAGFNPLNEISKMTGKSMAVLKKEMEDGGISANLVMKAMSKATGEGGLYHGMMEKQSKTTSGMLSTLQDNYNELNVVIGERFKPTIDAAIGGLSSMVATVKGWFEIPVSEKLRKETDHLQELRIELGFSNTTEKRRKDILEEIKAIQPDIVDGTKSEKEQLNSLNDSLDSYIGKRRQQIALEELKEQNLGAVTDYKEAENTMDDTYAKSAVAVRNAYDLGFRYPDGISTGQAFIAAKKFLEEKISSGKAVRKEKVIGANQGGAIKQGYTDEGTALLFFEELLNKNREAIATMEENQGAFKKYEESQAAINKLLGIKEEPPKKEDVVTDGGDTGGSGKGKSKNGVDVASISGGTKITHLTINIDSLVKDGVHIYKATAQEGVNEMGTGIKQNLLTAVNDANLAVGRQ